MEKSERLVAARKAKAWRKAGKGQPDDAQWDIVLAEYRDPMAEPAGAVWPVEKCVHPVPAMEPAQWLSLSEPLQAPCKLLSSSWWAVMARNPYCQEMMENGEEGR